MLDYKVTGGQTCVRPIFMGTLLNDFFFFQAEDGIRDYKVTGVQTCALPICPFGECLEPGLLGLVAVQGFDACLSHGGTGNGRRRRCLRRSEEHTSELQSPCNLVCRLLLEKKKKLAVTSIGDNI